MSLQPDRGSDVPDCQCHIMIFTVCVKLHHVVCFSWHSYCHLPDPSWKGLFFQNKLSIQPRGWWIWWISCISSDARCMILLVIWLSYDSLRSIIFQMYDNLINREHDWLNDQLIPTHDTLQLSFPQCCWRFCSNSINMWESFRDQCFSQPHKSLTGQVLVGSNALKGPQPTRRETHIHHQVPALTKVSPWHQGMSLSQHTQTKVSPWDLCWVFLFFFWFCFWTVFFFSCWWSRYMHTEQYKPVSSLCRHLLVNPKARNL